MKNFLLLILVSWFLSFCGQQETIDVIIPKSYTGPCAILVHENGVEIENGRVQLGPNGIVILSQDSYHDLFDGMRIISQESLTEFNVVQPGERIKSVQERSVFQLGKGEFSLEECSHESARGITFIVGGKREHGYFVDFERQIKKYFHKNDVDLCARLKAFDSHKN